MQSKENNTEHLISGRFWNPPYALCFFAWCTVCASRLLLLFSSLDCLPRLLLSRSPLSVAKCHALTSNSFLLEQLRTRFIFCVVCFLIGKLKMNKIEVGCTFETDQTRSIFENLLWLSILSVDRRVDSSHETRDQRSPKGAK